MFHQELHFLPLKRVICGRGREFSTEPDHFTSALWAKSWLFTEWLLERLLAMKTDVWKQVLLNVSFFGESGVMLEYHNGLY